MAPYRWQLDARVRRAQALLIDTRASLDQVAEATGFADAVHFGRTFRKFTGAHRPRGDATGKTDRDPVADSDWKSQNRTVSSANWQGNIRSTGQAGEAVAFDDTRLPEPMPPEGGR